MNILITGVGGPTPRSFAIALKKYSKFKEIKLIATDSNSLSIGLYQTDLFSKSFVIPVANDSNYWYHIEKIIVSENIQFAVILPEQEVKVWSRRQKDGVLPCKALIPEIGMVELLMNKAHMTEALKGLGVVPNSVEFSRHTKEFENVFSKLSFPFWVRSVSGTSGLGSLKIENADALRTWISINPGIENFIASTYLTGRNLACKMLYFNGNLLRTACAERVNYIMSKVAPSGITGNTSFGRLLNEPQLVDIAIKTMDFLFELTGTEKHGFFTVDFKEDAKGDAFITEINVRHVAFTQCFAAGGANLAADTIMLLANDPEFTLDYKMYEFEKDLIFLRDVDCNPIIMNETNLYK